ncbi:HIT family protein [Zhihengliuella sp.]|uniref:HIT family protein n=1 Tax=Zhihengliuella sp. TaxID=1954483 RepID=UPI002811978F|nr:HIT family protein [Zhihengliuella sp.]
MSTVFTKIIDGEIPGRFVWSDENVVGFLDVRPQTTGHVLVVPRREVDRWTEAEPELLGEVMRVAQAIGHAQVEVFGSARAGLTVMGFEVPHLHVHVWPVDSMADYDFAHPQGATDDASLDAAAQSLRDALRRAGHGDAVPAD